MSNYTSIMNSLGWNTVLFAESIPHLFHQDLAFLWVLEQDSPNRPASWQENTSAWKNLVELFLTGELTVESEDIISPFLDYTKRCGLESVQWVSLKNTDTRIGILSPAVLIRPLPDLSPVDIQAIEERLRSRPNANVFRHFVQLAVEYLTENQPDGSFRKRLARILEREFHPQTMAGPPSGSSLTIPVLDQIVWGQQAVGSASLQQVNILVPGKGEKVFVPKCSCGARLTRAREADPILVESRQFQVYCQMPECLQSNDLDLYDFLIWDRDPQTIVAWNKEGVPIPEKGFPPKAEELGNGEMFYEWNAALVGGERDKRFLRLIFTNKNIQSQKLDTVFFTKLLVLGSADTFSGLPVRPEWIDVLDAPQEIKAVAEGSPTKITYRQLKLKGLPVVVTKVFPSLSLHIEPELAAGIYPDPSLVPQMWKWYRFFLDGLRRTHYRVQTGSGLPILPWLSETTNGYDPIFSVSDSSNPGIGSTFWTQPSQNSPDSEASARIPLGIDFGTTNTTVYFLPPGNDVSNVTNAPTEFCLEPAKLSEVVLWKAKSASEETKTIGDFLPVSTYGAGRADPFLIPSMLWSFDHSTLIRWNSEKPTELARAERGFKWDRPNVDYSGLRRAYLRELLLLALPYILKRSREAGTITTWNLTFALGFAFPLAFGYGARTRMKEVYEELQKTLQGLTGFNYEAKSLNESLACTKLLGSLNQSQTFLVADMGGGTIDLALFVGNNEVPSQIGSIEFAGETYVDVFVGKQGILDAQSVRDLIFQGRCDGLYGGNATAIRILRRFMGVTFEFLRTMTAAHRKEHSGQTIHLVLAGNGWHLVEAFSKDTQAISSEKVFNGYFDNLIQQLGDDKFKRSSPVSGLPSYKHLVAIGALQNASKMGSDEITSSAVLPKLPSGRGLRFGDENLAPPMKLEWSELVGGQLSFGMASSEALKEIDLFIDLKDMAPLNDPWRSYLLSFFGVASEQEIPLPDENNLREQIRGSISSADPPSLSKGPLQLIMETYGAEWLKR